MAALVNLRNASAEGETQLTDLKDLQDLLQWHGCELCANYLCKVLLAGVIYRVLVALI
jgi:hypothetical protein